jgi:uncharacterized protein YoxC
MNKRNLISICVALLLISAFIALIWIDTSTQQRINKLETTVNGLSLTLNDLDTRLNILNSSLTGFNATLNGLNETVNGLNSTISGLSSSISGLETSVNILEDKVQTLENKTWHSQGSFALSQTNQNVTFNTHGEAWRLNYVFDGTNALPMTIQYNLRVNDSSGNIVAGLDGIELADLRNFGRGTLYIPEGQGTYSVQMTGITGNYSFTFEVQSYY